MSAPGPWWHQASTWLDLQRPESRLHHGNLSVRGIEQLVVGMSGARYRTSSDVARADLIRRRLRRRAQIPEPDAVRKTDAQPRDNHTTGPRLIADDAQAVDHALDATELSKSIGECASHAAIGVLNRGQREIRVATGSEAQRLANIGASRAHCVGDPTRECCRSSGQQKHGDHCSKNHGSAAASIGERSFAILDRAARNGHEDPASRFSRLVGWLRAVGASIRTPRPTGYRRSKRPS